MPDLSGYTTATELAQLFGVSARRVEQLTHDGVIATTVAEGIGRRYEFEPTVKAYIKYLSDKAYGREQRATEAELKEQKLKAEIALKESQGELHRLKTDIAAGKYISVEEITLDYTRFFAAFKNFALALPARVADQISAQTDPLELRRIEKDMQEDIRRLLTSFTVAGGCEPPDPIRRVGRPRKGTRK